MQFLIFAVFLSKWNATSLFKRVVPKGLDHTLSVITVSLYVCECNVVLMGGGVEPHWFQNGQ